jgi:hypothetical protein
VEGVVTTPIGRGVSARRRRGFVQCEPFRTFAIGQQGREPPLEDWAGPALALTAEFAQAHGLKGGAELLLVNSEVRTARRRPARQLRFPGSPSRASP